MSHANTPTIPLNLWINEEMDNRIRCLKKHFGRESSWIMELGICLIEKIVEGEGENYDIALVKILPHHVDVKKIIIH